MFKLKKECWVYQKNGFWAIFQSDWNNRTFKKPLHCPECQRNFSITSTRWLGLDEDGLTGVRKKNKIRIGYLGKHECGAYVATLNDSTPHFDKQVEEYYKDFS